MGSSIRNLNNKTVLTAPSILAADFAKLADEIARVENAGADIIHIDVMDGHFVPNISIGVPVVKSLRKVTELPFDVHLMISEPLKYIEAFADAGADNITFHLESDDDPLEVIDAIHSAGCTAGISIKPKTHQELLYPFLSKIELVLVMTVEPGFGGQSFMADMMQKVCDIRKWINSDSLDVHLEVDGGIDAETVHEAVSAGANMLVAGTYIFRHPEGAETAISSLKQPEL